ncbi:MAG: hypothetical protein RIR24_71 [Actinomycetota bacterium]|jgi:hypothetical protein
MSSEPNNEELARLLRANIEASNRTTHAVRAIVRFVFLQLSLTTICALLIAAGAALNLNQVFVPLSSITWIAGSIFAGLTARRDLKSSAVPKG